ncbi:phosphonate ABC transporter substrate-binding protein [Alkalihalobacillus alcalophilus ATCC 27647 = CGMCC 1.3604]|uniref:Phosphonate ABC transporter substrate-binding protein n=1 Tax=Alkalihalobacillus alcalophilus ATCC 27647 = CGMCC 1.3604 TaxID=1218173 RepID=A0A094XF09_ALKAL|nr:phosphate/phosphite/phosphonate ABC transporter substrate-binding protein [Alkalihalobacillus alcalophilus]KGA97345.1 phosphonate ABC transporter substrate-binding protein [Alkalihalobacillus alcalophilus ATCC 27647 = CGMCC 1.3604]MED1560912.1 phosphate/phosphite/phosphonate ABC transporter substrate-binding protein [Alkalihalobacillus alcalophilus]THG90388.1 phosphonate ABC transporter substrate-binding protein [Alkalihalobacillus alcalophilus ATCC 27647 = CGMCC 1.3604]
MSKKILLMLFSLFMAVALVACGTGDDSNDDTTGTGGSGDEGATDEGTAELPDEIIMGFVPSTDAEKIADNIGPISDKLSEILGVQVSGQVMTNFSALVEAMGNDQVHIGFIPAFGYVLATERYDNVEVILKSIRHGSGTYRAQYTVRADSDIQTLEDLEGKIWAFADITSTSGYLFPAAQFMDEFGVEQAEDFVGDVVPTGNHDNALITVLEGDADFATTFEDARTNIVGDYPDAMDELRQLDFTDEIPNDTISVNTNLLNQELVDQIYEAFMSFNEDEEMLHALDEIYNWTGIDKATDDEYDVIRSVYEKFSDSPAFQ